MSKLSDENKFLDFSDYGRSGGKLIANLFKNTKVTPIHVTWMFVLSALISIVCILQEKYILAGFFILLKSIIDAADGELARLKKTPSYTGRYLDSISDILINFLLFITFAYVSYIPFSIAFFAFLCFQMQGTLYNFYYVILRNKSINGDTTSRIFENTVPTALPGESQKMVTFLYRLYRFLYGSFDWIIYKLDFSASKVRTIPKWFMTMVSIYGLGFQLLIMSVLLVLNLKEFIILFFSVYSLFILFFIGIRKLFIS